MKRRDLLKIFRNQLEKLGATFPVFEVYLTSDYFLGLSISRTLLISGAESAQAIKDYFETHSNVLIPDHFIATYTDLSSVLESTLIDQELVDLSLNWRGRLFKWGDIKDLQFPVYRDMVLSSYWRFIVTKRGDYYFARYEMSPVYYIHGHSTAGFKEFKNELRHFVEFLKSKKDTGQTDLDLDRVVIFARKEPEKTFSRCMPQFFDQNNYLTLRSFESKRHSLGDAELINQIEASISQVLN